MGQPKMGPLQTFEASKKGNPHRLTGVSTMKCPFCAEELSVQHSAVLDDNYLCAGLPDNWLSLNPRRFDCRSHSRSPSSHIGDCFMFLSTATYYYKMGSWLLLKPRRAPKHKGKLIGTAVIQD